MSIQEFNLLRALSERVGIKTAKDLERFKKQTGATSNNALIKRLCLYIASETKWEG